MTPEQKWRSDMLKITLIINNKPYLEAFNRSCDLDFNLILYLVKFLNKLPEDAAKSVHFKEFCLVRKRSDRILIQGKALKEIHDGDEL